MEATAYHEAGHAFMATQQGARVRSVTIDPDNDDGPERFGDTQVIGRQGRLSDRAFRERAIRVSLAGPVAEMLDTGDPYHPGLVAEWANDWQTAWELAEPLIPDHRRRLDDLEQTTGQLDPLRNAEPNWSAIASLADHLLAHETLEAEVVLDIVNEGLG